MKTIVILVMLAACGGGKQQPPPNKPADGVGSSAPSSNVGNCLSDADCDGKRCDTCPSTCGSGAEACAQVCGAPVCVAK